MYSTTALAHFQPTFLPTHESTFRQTGRLPPFTKKQSKLKHPLPADEATRLSGLRTPPADDMGTTYEAPSLASCGSRHAHHSAFISTLPSNDRPKATLNDAIYEPTSKYTLPSQQHAQVFTQSRANAGHPASHASTSRHSTRPSTPQSGPIVSADPSTATRDATMVLHSLQIPACVSPRGGNLADFAAQVSWYCRHGPLFPYTRAILTILLFLQNRSLASSGSSRSRHSKLPRMSVPSAPRLPSVGSPRMRFRSRTSRSGFRRCSRQPRLPKTSSSWLCCSFTG